MEWVPFETSVQQQSILLAHIYLVVLSGTGIIVYAVLAERKKTASTLEISKDVAIASLASLSETRDHETGAHIMRTRHYVRILAEQLQKNGPLWTAIDRYAISKCCTKPLRCTTLAK